VPQVTMIHFKKSKEETPWHPRLESSKSCISNIARQQRLGNAKLKILPFLFVIRLTRKSVGKASKVARTRRGRRPAIAERLFGLCGVWVIGMADQRAAAAHREVVSADHTERVLLISIVFARTSADKTG